MEQHVELDEHVKRRVAHDFAHRWASCLVIKHQDVGAHYVDISIAHEEVDLSLDAVSDTDIVWIHPRHKISLHIKRYLHACVECFRQASILWQRVDDELARVRLSRWLYELHRAHVCWAVINEAKYDGPFVRLSHDDAFDGLLDVVWACIEDWHDDNHLRQVSLLLSLLLLLSEALSLAIDTRVGT